MDQREGAAEGRDGAARRKEAPELCEEVGVDLSFKECSWFSIYRIAHRVADIVEAGSVSLGARSTIIASGPLAAIPRLLRLQADLTGRSVRAAMERIGQVRHDIAEGRVTVEDVPRLYDELTDLYVTARRSLERGEAALRVSKEGI